MDDRTFSVSELGEALRLGLEQLFPYGVWVEGHISGMTRRRNGHVYFDLIEPGPAEGDPPVATVPVVLFRESRDRVNRMLRRHGNPVRMDDGVQIRIQGVVDFYPPSGRLQLRMTTIDPTYTIGRMAAARDALLARLSAEGLLDRNHRAPLVELPLRIGLVTSLGSAAHADVHEVLRASRLAFTVLEADTPVQGQGAEIRIAAAITTLTRCEVDLVVVARGGGSRSDLAPFDHEAVARAIAAASVPVFTGLGHEIDRCVADELAHSAHPTPTAAAQAVVALVEQWLVRLDNMAARIANRGRHGLGAAAAEVDRLQTAGARAGRVALDRAGERLAGRRAALVAATRTTARMAESHVEAAGRRLVLSGPRRLVEAGREVEAVAARVAALDPAVVLARGWSITRRADGGLVRSVDEVDDGDELVTQVADGTLTSTIHGARPGGTTP